MTRQWSVLVSALSITFGAHAVPSCEGEGGAGGESPDASAADAASADGATAPDGASDSSTPDGSTTSTDAGVEPGDAGATCVVPDASTLDEASVAAGFDSVWQVYRCWSCHQNSSQTVSATGEGITLSGNNAGLGDSGTVFPPNLTNDPTTGIGCWTDQELQSAIRDGQDRNGGTLCPSMPRWGNALATSDGGVRAGTPMDAGTAQEIIDYMRSLPVVTNQVPDTTCAAPASPPDAGTAGPDGSPE